MKYLMVLAFLAVGCNSSDDPTESADVQTASQKYHLLNKVGNSDFIESKTQEEGYAQNCYSDDVYFEQAETQVFRDIEKHWNDGNYLIPENLLSNNFNGNSLVGGTIKKREDIGNGISLNSFKLSDKKINAKSVDGEIKKYFGEFAEIKNVRLIASDYTIGLRQRDEKLSPSGYTVDLSLVVKGKDQQARRREDRVLAQAQIVKVDKQWFIDSLKFKSKLSLHKKAPHFASLELDKAGLGSIKSYERLEAIRRGGYTLAMSDINNDNNVDFLLGSYGKLKLFTGAGDGTFKEVKKSGIEEHTLVKSAIWADFDNDGLKDLLIVRFVGMDSDSFEDHVDKQSNELQSKIDRSKEPKANAVVIYKNLGNTKFKKMSEIVDSLPTEHAMPATVADFNNDGLLDIYVGYPGVKDFTTFANDAPEKVGKKAQGVYLNKGDMTFFEKSMHKQADYEVFSEENTIYPHSSIAVDYNQDGHVDIVVVDDRGNLSLAYKNLGNAEFVMDNNNIGFQNYGIGMGLAVADVNNDGEVDMALSNVSFLEKNRLARACSANWGVDVDKDDDLMERPGLRLFTSSNQSEKLKDKAKEAGLYNIGEGLGGVEFLDYDNDGLQDLYISNGLWSGTDRSFELAGTFNRALKHYVEEGIYEGPVSTRSFMMDVLANYRNEGGEAPSMAGFQENKLFRNLGDGNFYEVGYLEGVDSIADGYVVGTADINNDGAIDIVLRNADPGSDLVSYPPIQVFLSKKIDRNAVAVTLEGTASNRDAIGAELTGTVKGQPVQVRQMIANNGTIQSEHKLWFSLGKADSMKELKIRWPSGKVQVLKDVKPGEHHIVEGSNPAVISQSN